MKRVLISIGMVLVAVATAGSTDVQSRKIRLRNQSDTTVYNVHVAETKDRWSQDQLRAETLRPNELKVLTVLNEQGGCRLDMRAVFSDNAVSLGYALDVCDADAEIDITKAGITRP